MKTLTWLEIVAIALLIGLATNFHKRIRALEKLSVAQVNAITHAVEINRIMQQRLAEISGLYASTIVYASQQRSIRGQRNPDRAVAANPRLPRIRSK